MAQRATKWLTALSQRISQSHEKRARQRVRGILLLFHEVHDDDDQYMREFKTGCTAAFLDAIIIWLCRHHWDFIPLEQVMSRLERDDVGRRFAVFTFDDGYRNTVTRALPILARYNAPFTVYAPTGAITRELPSWWLGLRQLFQNHNAISVDAMATAFDCRDIAAKINAHTRVKHWVKQDYRRATALAETFRAYGISLPALNHTYFMDEGALQSLACHPLANIGAHSQSHRALSILGDVEVKQEMVQNKRFLEVLLDRPVGHFAYPYGIFGDREVALAAATGFQTAVTTESEFVSQRHGMAPHQLPRIEFSGTTSHLDYCIDVLCRIQ